MMEKLLKLKKYMKDWKVITACVAVVALVGGIAIFVTADSFVSFTFEQSDPVVFNSTDDKKTIKIANVSGNDTALNPSASASDITLDEIVPYVDWRIDQLTANGTSKDVISFTANGKSNLFLSGTLTNSPFANFDSANAIDGTNNANKDKIKAVEIQKKHAGKALVTATYNSPAVNAASGSLEGKISSKNVTVYVPLNHSTFNATEQGVTSAVDVSKPYKMGTSFSLITNTGANNKAILEFSSNSNVSGFTQTDGVGQNTQLSNFTLNGGGYTYITVRTNDCDMSILNDKTNLSTIKTVLGEVKFFPEGTVDSSIGELKEELSSGEKYLFLKNDKSVFNNGEQGIEIPCTVKDWVNSGVKYKVEDSSICEFKDGRIIPKKAGVTKITAEVEGTQAKDSFNVVVPFVVVSCPEVVNVGDEFELVTSAGQSVNVTFGSVDPLYVATVPEKYGTYVAKKAGKTYIVASLVLPSNIDQIFDSYYPNGWDRIECPITIIDDFTVDIHEAYVSIGGDPVEIKALGTDTDYVKNPVGYEIVSQYGPNGPPDVVSGDLISVVKKEGKEDTFVISGLSGGTVNLRIYQTVNGVKKFDTCKIMVTTPVSDMIINPSEIKVDEGGVSENVVLSFEPEPTNNKVIWKSSDESIATIEEIDKHTIRVHGVKGGSTTINAISLDDTNKVVQAVVKVRKPITGLRIKNNDEADPESGILTLDYAAKQYQLVAEITPEKTSEDDGVNRNVTWRSTNPKVAEVDPASGLVTFIGPGFVSITCDAEDKGADKNTTFSDSINLYITVPVTSIKLDTTKATIRKGDSLRITADVTPATASNKNLIWESSDTSVATVSPNGVVTAVGTGRCTILCKSSDPSSTASAMCNIFVMQPVTGIELNTTEITVRKGQVFWLNANCLPTDADDKSVTWSSNNEEICTVEQDGKVTAVEAGTTTIVAMSNDSGMLATCKVIVTQPVTGIKLNSSYQEMWVGSKYAIIPTVEPIDAENKNVTYFSSDSSVASVDEYGVVTALKGGNTIIEVTTEEYHLTATCTIVVKEYVSSITLSEHEKFLNVTETGTLTAECYVEIN